MKRDINDIAKEYQELNIFNSSQLWEIGMGLKGGLTEEQVKVYADTKYDWVQMEQIRLGLEACLSDEQISIYADTKYDWTQMEQIRLGLEACLSDEQISIYADTKYDWTQMEQIRLGQDNGLIDKQINQYANPEFKADKMWEIREKLENEKITFSFSKDRDEEMRKQFLKSNSFFKMKADREYIKELYISSSKENGFIDELKEDIKNDIDEGKDIPDIEYELEKRLDKYFDYEEERESFVKSYYSHNSNEIQKLILDTSDYVDILEVLDELKHKDFSVRDEEVEVMCKAVFKGYDWEDFNDILKNNFYTDEIKEIIEGIENGLSINQIKIYANTDFNSLQMEQIRLGLEYGISDDWVEVYAEPKHSAYDMSVMRERIEDGKPLSEVLDGFKETITLNIDDDINESLRPELEDELTM